MNVVGLSGNSAPLILDAQARKLTLHVVGVYGTAPFWGYIVDHRGPRGLLALAFISLLVGYNGIRHFYDAGLPDGARDISTLAFLALVFCSFLTGIGGNGGLTSAINSTAKSFPDKLVRCTWNTVYDG